MWINNTEDQNENHLLTDDTVNVSRRYSECIDMYVCGICDCTAIVYK